MRAGGCAVQQGLTSEAAAVVKQAVALSKRRGHAQVTPLHVANTMLAASTGLLRVACQQSHSHPLQCKALDLCFNVALNRLPSSSPSPMVSHHSQYPSISNALVAAFKRAQAHQRRGSVENQQQPLLTVKIELEQLIMSILDDPSVSRVMREAGFSSTQVKSKVEKAVSLELCSRSSSPPPSNNKSIKDNRSLLSLQPSSVRQDERKINRSTAPEPTKNDDVSIIIETLLMSRKRKGFAIVGESIPNIESTVKELMDRVDKGGVPEGLREVKFISITPLYSFCNLHSDLVEQKMGELTCLVKSLVANGVVLYVGDLNWISEYRVNFEQERSGYCSVEHMIMELGRLVSGIGETGRLWLVGIATFQTYMRCRTGYHPLEAVWGLHPVTIPVNGLGLSLISHRDEHTESRHRSTENGPCQLPLANGEVKLSCCADCTSKFEAEARCMQTNTCNTNGSSLSSLPPWLKEESRRLCNNDQNRESIRKLRKEWNSYCSSAHRQLSSHERALAFSSASPSSSASCFSFDQQNTNTRDINHFPQPESTRKDNHCWPSNFIHILDNGDTVHAFSSNPNSSRNSPSSRDFMDTGYTQKFKEFNAQNLNILCDALEKKVPWRREIIPEIARTVLECRSGMSRRKGPLRDKNDVKEETWLFFLGPDGRAKEKFSRELAKIVFGSYSSFASIGICGFTSVTGSNSSDDYRNKRGRDEGSCISYIERFAQAVSANPHRVFLLEDLELADSGSYVGIRRASEMGRMSNERGEEVSLRDAIVVLSCERLKSGSGSTSPSCRQKTGNETGGAGEEATTPCVPLDLNISFDDVDGVGNQSIGDLGILENIVDRRVVFQSSGLVEY